MASRLLDIAPIAEHTIEDVFKQYLRSATYSNGISKVDRRAAIELFTDCINGYGHQSLSEKEDSVFDQYYSLESIFHKEFCQIFGPDKIAENVDEFVGSFLIRKVMLPRRQMAVVAMVIAELCQWLVAQNLVHAESVRDAIVRAKEAAKNLPLAEEASRLLCQQTKKWLQDLHGVQEYFDYGRTNISRVEEQSIWLQSMDGKEIGPVSLPPEATRLLQPSWSINCALIKSSGIWHMSEVGNVYPN